MNPILLILGPSGIGKSTLADRLAEDFDFLHFNIDYWDGKGIDGGALRKYISDPQSLRLEVDQRLNGKKGAVLTFASTFIPDINYIKIAEEGGIKTLILYGPKELCLDAFLKRGTPPLEDPVKHWHKYNDNLYDGSMIKPEHTPFVIDVFNGRDRKSYESLLQEILERGLISG